MLGVRIDHPRQARRDTSHQIKLRPGLDNARLVEHFAKTLETKRTFLFRRQSNTRFLSGLRIDESLRGEVKPPDSDHG
jgi:hypothetical protein